MKLQRWLLAALSGAALVLAPAAVPGAPTVTGQAAALAADRSGQPGGGRGGGLLEPTATRPPGGGTSDQTANGLCRPGTPPNAPPTTSFLSSNPLLGPAVLPTASPVGPLLAGYQRFGALSEAQFSQQYMNGTQTAYVFPPAGGFVIAPDGRPVAQAQTLLAGYRLDRFGFPGGAFLSPLGTPFSSRALPPQSLNTPENAPLANYHVYCVLQPFTVDSGPIAPWFAQPGQGTQFRLNPAYLPQAGSSLTVTWLLQNGYLVEENLLQ
ncbi:TNT domain-containing protein [Micromonospora sp. B11E3]|uniref:TNT domain-containing protein n=1 Tax=Micromonospora sp. B11E3 TaxID=3153562 RepID=UPI00325D59ED